jgi:predicted PurR-regulated permease PerM
MLTAERSTASRLLIYAGCFFLVIIGLKFTAYVFTIVVISLILTLIANPAMERMRKRGLPDILSATILTVIAVICILVLIAISLYSFGVLVRDLPLYQEEFNTRMGQVTALLGSYGFQSVDLSTPDLASIMSLVVSSVMSLSDLLLYLFFIGVTTFFMMLEAPHFAERLRKLSLFHPDKLARLGRLSGYMIDFVVVRTETNLVHGILFGGTLYAMGVHAALLWGVLTFVLAYIPYFGLIIAAIPAIFFAWLQFGIWGAVAVIALVCVLNLIVENPVFSYFSSRTYEIPAVLVILSVIFWGWLLGLAGMVFAVPLTIMVLIIFQVSDDLAWVNELLGADRIFGGVKEKQDGERAPE